jgi:hypothetical protein
MSNKEDLSHLVVSDPFWSDNYKILFDLSRIKEFVPTDDMSINEKLNAISRFLIYAGILLYFLYQDYLFMYVPILGLALVYYVYIGKSNIKEGFTNDVKNIETDYHKPSKNNPFMNVLLSDNTDRSPASDIDDPKIKKDMKQMFEHGLYTNANDIWDKNNSHRQYYTNPSTTIPNDRSSFMNWCYNTPYVCKAGDQHVCLKRENLKGHGRII